MANTARAFVVVALLAGVTACGTVTTGEPTTATGRADRSAGTEVGAGKPGPHNAITDVPGIEVGQVQSSEDGYLTGTTVVHTPAGMTVAGVDVRGGAPGTHETNLLDPQNSNPGANAIVLSGGSAYGLATTSGVMRWLEEHDQGFPVGDGVVPIVPGAIIYDLGRGGEFENRPDADWGYRAIDAARNGPVALGTVGAGTGARAGGLKGGVGTASVRLEDGTMVAALVVVNAAGSPLAPDCSLLGTVYGIADEFAGLRTPSEQECADWQDGSGSSMNTTIAVVATDATMEKAAAAKLASVGHDGLARAINPAHSLSDGDTVFSLATGQDGKQLAVNDPESVPALNEIYRAGADTLSRAIAHALLSAESAGDMTAYCEQFPSACRDWNGR